MQQGAIVKGVVMQAMPVAAFVRLDYGPTAMLHVNDISQSNFKNLAKVLPVRATPCLSSFPHCCTGVRMATDQTRRYPDFAHTLTFSLPPAGWQYDVRAGVQLPNQHGGR